MTPNLEMFQKMNRKSIKIGFLVNYLDFTKDENLQAFVTTAMETMFIFQPVTNLLYKTKWKLVFISFITSL